MKFNHKNLCRATSRHAKKTRIFAVIRTPTVVADIDHSGQILPFGGGGV